MSPDAKAVPAIPPISAIADPNARAVLQALVNGWQVRNGQSGDGSRKFLTEADVGLTVNNYFSSVARGVTGGGGSQSPGGAGDLVDAVTRMIINSREWAALNERIQIIQSPDWLRDAMYAALEPEMTELRTLAANVGQALAGIGYLDQARTTLERSVVESFKALIAEYGVSTAGVNTVQKAIATYADANALQISQIYATVDGVRTVAIEEASEVRADIDGALSGLYTLKVDAAGHVAGMSIGVTSNNEGETTSNIVFKADNFAIGGRDVYIDGVLQPPVVPFIVKTTDWTDEEGVTHPPGTYMNNVTITSANVDKLVLDYGKVTGGLYEGVSAGIPKWYISRDGTPSGTGAVYWFNSVWGNGLSIGNLSAHLSGGPGANLWMDTDILLEAGGAHLHIGPAGADEIWIGAPGTPTTELTFYAATVNMDATTKAAFRAALGI